MKNELKTNCGLPDTSFSVNNKGFSCFACLPGERGKGRALRLLECQSNNRNVRSLCTGFSQIKSPRFYLLSQISTMRWWKICFRSSNYWKLHWLFLVCTRTSFTYKFVRNNESFTSSARISTTVPRCIASIPSTSCSVRLLYLGLMKSLNLICFWINLDVA